MPRARVNAPSQDRPCVAALAASETVVFPDDASAAAGTAYLTDPLKLEQLLTG
jgi:hypothetical protein